MKKLESFTLDYSKWRSGGDSVPNKVGEGPTLLRNQQGFMCCLGQFCIQAGYEPLQLNGLGEPDDLAEDIPHLTVLSLDNEEGDYWNTNLTDEAIQINDTINTTPDEKLVELKKLFEAEGIKFSVINHPEGKTFK